MAHTTTGSVYLPNGYRLAFNCDSVVPASVATKKAQAYVERTGKTIYVPGLGTFSSTPPEPPADPIKKVQPQR